MVIPAEKRMKSIWNKCPVLPGSTYAWALSAIASINRAKKRKENIKCFFILFLLVFNNYSIIQDANQSLNIKEVYTLLHNNDFI